MELRDFNDILLKFVSQEVQLNFFRNIQKIFEKKNFFLLITPSKVQNFEKHSVVFLPNE